jgi:hypothetical protein
MMPKKPAAADTTMSDLAKIMKDPKACKIDCKQKCAGKKLISFKHDGRLACTRSCTSACSNS